MGPESMSCTDLTQALEVKSFLSPNHEDRRQADTDLSASVMAALATQQVGCQFPLRFPPELERHFLADSANRRVSLVLRRSPVVILTFVGMLPSDWFMVPDRFQAAMLIRSAVFIPLYLLTLHLFTRRSTSSSRDWILVGAAVLTAMQNLFIIVPSASPLACAYLATLSVVVVCWDSILRPAFLPALVHCIVVMAGFGVALMMLPDNGGTLAIPIGVMVLSSMVFSLYGTYTLERAERVAYLQELHQRLLRGKLNAVNMRLHQQARLDPLTGIPNRRHFDETMTQIWRPQQDGSKVAAVQISVLLLDVDFFKPYNDKYGHPAGDRCLQAVAQVLAQCVRQPEDLVARIGGEEFVVVLSGTSNQRALEVADRIHGMVKALALPHESRPDGAGVVTISIGLVTGGPMDLNAMQNLVAEADKALYRAKVQGRDCVVNGSA